MRDLFRSSARLKLVVVGFLSLLLLIGAGIKLSVSRQPKTLWDKYQKVQLGMRKDQFQAILGPPARIHRPGIDWTVFSWIEDDQELYIFCAEPPGDDSGVCNRKICCEKSKRRWWPFSSAKAPSGKAVTGWELLDDVSD
jgi:hypothetical protein